MKTNPVALVTGGLQGIGAACVRALAEAGFDVAVADLAETAELPEIQGVRLRYYRLDIADTAAHEACLEKIAKELGAIDCLLNNAGIAARPLTDILELGTEAFDRSIAVNLRGTFFLTQKTARHMLAHTGTHYRSIINISSIAAEMANTDRSQYCVSKAGLSMTGKLFAQRLAADGIAVHEVRPGLIRTQMTATSGSSIPDQWVKEGRVPQKRWGTPEDIARAVVSLATGALPYMTGEVLTLAGGMNIPASP